MPTAADFTEQEWKLVLEGPTSAGTIVITAQRGGRCARPSRCRAHTRRRASSMAVEPDVREAIAQRALSAGASASHSGGDQILFGGSVLIASGQTPQH